MKVGLGVRLKLNDVRKSNMNNEHSVLCVLHSLRSELNVGQFRVNIAISYSYRHIADIRQLYFLAALIDHVEKRIPSANWCKYNKTNRFDTSV